MPDVFGKTRLPADVPKEVQRVVSLLSKQKNKQACLKLAYDILTKKYHGYRLMTYVKLYEVPITDVNWLWHRKALHCTSLNYLLRILLVRSGWFTDDDIAECWTLVWWISPHQYCDVKVGKKIVHADIWNGFWGVPFGSYARGFGYS